MPHRTEPRGLFAAGDTGLFASRDGGARWERVGEPGALPTIWTLAVSSDRSARPVRGRAPVRHLPLAGRRPRVERLAAPVAQQCSIGTAFVTSLVVDPDDPHTIWAGVEIDGVFRSRDGGESWERVEAGLHDPDIHAMAVAQSCPKRLFASTAGEMFISADLGDTWEAVGIKSRWPPPYARGLAVRPDDPDVLLRRLRRDHHGHDRPRAPERGRRTHLGRAPPCPGVPTRRCGDSPRIRPTAGGRRPSRCSARCTSARTPATRGGRSTAPSERSGGGLVAGLRVGDHVQGEGQSRRALDPLSRRGRGGRGEGDFDQALEITANPVGQSSRLATRGPPLT